MRDVEKEIEAKKIEVHEEYLDSFRSMYLTIGDLHYKKERNMEELDKKIQLAHIQQVLCVPPPPSAPLLLASPSPCPPRPHEPPALTHRTRGTGSKAATRARRPRRPPKPHLQSHPPPPQGRPKDTCAVCGAKPAVFEVHYSAIFFLFVKAVASASELRIVQLSKVRPLSWGYGLPHFGVAP